MLTRTGPSWRLASSARRAGLRALNRSPREGVRSLSGVDSAGACIVATAAPLLAEQAVRIATDDAMDRVSRRLATKGAA